MPCDEGIGRITRAFDEWQLTESDVLNFTRLGARVLKQFYDRTWEDRATTRAIPNGPGLPDLFHDAVEDLWPDDFEWMFLGGALKDPGRLRGRSREGDCRDPELPEPSS